MSKIKKKNWYIEHQKVSAKARAARKLGYKEGSAAAILTAYLAIKDFGVPGFSWLSDRLGAVAKKSPPPNTALDELVTRSIVEHMRSYDPKGAARIEAEFQNLLVGSPS